MTGIRSQIIGCGSHLPERIVTNAELAERMDTSDDWIVARTGITQRHIAADGEVTSDLGVRAGAASLADAGVEPAEVDAVIVATTTPDDTFPATATRVQAKMKLVNAFAFDVQAVCSGFVFALAVADNFIRLGQARTALVIGAETYSRILDWEDRATCVLFGDGAGAVVLRAGESDVGEPGAAGWGDARGILSSRLYSDGRHRDILYVDGGPSATQTVGHLRMSGKEVFRHAVKNLASAAEQIVAVNGMSLGDIDWLVPHQANLRIIEGLSRKLNVPQERIVTTIDRHANTSAASIPLALDEAVHDGRIKRGDIVLMEGIGGGLAWGASLVRW
ncbi:MAG: ketoacyl-ACP synthase III [Rhodospirillales bacterium]|nr:ketoacyl-ACP synthase III [Rhodospirillales bacterium]